MIRTRAFSLFCLLLTLPIAALAVPIEDLSQAWYAARQSGDADAIQRLLTDDFSVAFADGTTGDGAALVEAIRKGTHPALNAGTPAVSAVRAYDAAAIVDAVYRYQSTVTETKWVEKRKVVAGRVSKVMVEEPVETTSEAAVRVYELWVRDDGAFKLALVQLTPLGGNERARGFKLF